jgi:Xaa-Pro aminopeptidase
MADRRPQRLAAVIAALDAQHLDGLLLSALPNIRYLTGFSGSSALAFIAVRGDVLLLTDFRYQAQVREEVGDFARVEIQPQSLWTGLWQTLASAAGLEMVGFESAHLAHRDFQRLLDESGGARWRWRATTDIVERQRERKDADKVANIAEAARIAIAALGATLPVVRPGMTEYAVAGTLEHALRDAGSEAFAFPTIVASGPRSALPHARASEREVRAGDLLLFDFGASFEGYCSDVTRTVVVGKADAEQRAVYEVVRGANEAAAAQVRPGMSGRDADAVARCYIQDRGWGEAFGHSLGHGLGLEVHEAPRLSRTADEALPAGAVVTVEPGIYRAGWGGIRIEDDVHVRDEASGGPQILTPFTRELIELR